MSDTTDDADRHYAHVAAVTVAASGAWLSLKDMGNGVSEQVRDAVIALMTERNPRAKYRMITERAELRDGEAERFLDHALFFFRLTPRLDPSYVRLFKTHLEMIKEVRAGWTEP